MNNTFVFTFLRIREKTIIQCTKKICFIYNINHSDTKLCDRIVFIFMKNIEVNFENNRAHYEKHVLDYSFFIVGQNYSRYLDDENMSKYCKGIIDG